MRFLILTIVLSFTAQAAENYSMDYITQYVSCQHGQSIEESGIINFGMATSEDDDSCADNQNLKCVSDYGFYTYTFPTQEIFAQKNSTGRRLSQLSDEADFWMTTFSLDSDESLEKFLSITDSVYNEGVLIKEDIQVLHPSEVLDQWAKFTQIVDTCLSLEIKFKIRKR